MTRLAGLLRTWFELDHRSLALFRMALATVLLADLAIRWPWIEAHYTADGVLPAHLVRDFHQPPGAWSLHLLRDDLGFQQWMFGVAAAFALALLVGAGTRIAAVGSWVMLYSLHSRGPIFLNTGDDLLRLFCLWAIFLPLGRVGSADARGTAPPPATALTPATVALVLQVVVVYWMVVLRRWDVPEWGARGTAVWWAFQMDAYTSPIGIWVRDNLGSLLRPMTWVALFVEGPCTLLVFSPWRTPQLRTAAVFLFLGLHLSFAVLMQVGLFWAVSCTGWLALLPSWFWDRLGAARRVVPGRDAHAHPAVALPVATIGLLSAFTLYQGVYEKLPNAVTLPAPIATATTALRLRQTWIVYSPPGNRDGWFVPVGTLADGRRVDLWTGADPMTWARPADLGTHYLNQRWRIFLFLIDEPFRRHEHRPLALWLARRWERDHPGDVVAQVHLHWVYVESTRKGEKPPEIRDVAEFRIPRHR